MEPSQSEDEPAAAAAANSAGEEPIKDVDSEKPLQQSSKTTPISLNDLKGIERAMEMLTMYPSASAKSTEEAMKRKYEFWQTQPVPRLG